MVSRVLFFITCLLMVLTGNHGCDSNVRTTNGGCCFFPFRFRGRPYHNCTTKENGYTPWCATSPKFDEDHQWANCKIVDPCDSHPCKNGGICSEYGEDSETCFKCECPFDFEGLDCSVKKYLPISCLDILQRNSSAKDGDYTIKTKITAGHSKVYCQMTSLPGCSGGGWTLVMKIDGKKETFSYWSSYWENREAYNTQAGLTGIDDEETKLPTYWSTRFKELCVGMKVDSVSRFISIDYEAPSLHNLIADGQYRSTNIGRPKWKSLINKSSLQHNCNREGFNVYDRVRRDLTERARLGIIGNENNDCKSPDSYIGFGGIANALRNNQACGKFKINTCGNLARCPPTDNGKRNIRAIGYIFVR